MPVHELDLKSNLAILLAGTYGRGAWQLNLGGSTGGGNVPQDRFEPNETSERATDLGVIVGSAAFPNLTVATHANGLPDYDWYRVVPNAAGRFTTSITERPVSGSLELHLVTVDAQGTLVELSNSTAPGITTRTLTATDQAGQVMLVEVKGHPASTQGIFGIGSYDMTLTQS